MTAVTSLCWSISPEQTRRIAASSTQILEVPNALAEAIT